METFNKQNRPKLVEKKIIKRAIRKQHKNIKTNYKFLNTIKNCFKENMGIIVVSIILSMLLFFRYKEVQKNKRRQNKLIRS